MITGSGGLVEIQATAEGAVFSEDELDTLAGVWRAAASSIWSDCRKQAIDGVTA